MFSPSRPASCYLPPPAAVANHIRLILQWMPLDAKTISLTTPFFHRHKACVRNFTHNAVYTVQKLFSAFSQKMQAQQGSFLRPIQENIFFFPTLLLSFSLSFSTSSTLIFMREKKISPLYSHIGI
jgi:hypothetical protein